MTSYTLASYASMLDDPTRMPAYLEALKRAIRPGCVVLDLGAGFGYFALAACHLGAARVYAIEPAESIDMLPELARQNGFGDRIVALREMSTRVILPERADVIVADIRGTVPMISGSLRTMIDARERFLAPGGVLLPWRDRLFFAPVCDPGAWSSVVEPWTNRLPSEGALELRLNPVRERMAHQWRRRELNPRSLMAPGQIWAEIDYRTNTSADVEGSVEFRLDQPGIVHGFGSWFEAEIMAVIRYSTAPGQLPTVYGTGFFPLLRPLVVQAGDVLSVRVSATDVSGEYHMRWRTELRRGERVVASFDQGDFFSRSFDLARLKRRLPTHVPSLKPDGELALKVLEGAHQGRSIGQIASDVREAFPDRFATLEQAIDHAAQLIERVNG